MNDETLQLESTLPEDVAETAAVETLRCRRDAEDSRVPRGVNNAAPASCHGMVRLVGDDKVDAGESSKGFDQGFGDGGFVALGGEGVEIVAGAGGHGAKSAPGAAAHH